MDPISILSALAGITSAGATVVASLYTLVQTVRNAPAEMKDIAREMSDLTCVLEHLHELASEGHRLQLVKPGLFRIVKSSVENIGKTQDEILGMIDDRSIIRRLRWKKSKPLLDQIQTHKLTICMQVSILSWGTAIKKHSSE